MLLLEMFFMEIEEKIWSLLLLYKLTPRPFRVIHHK
jgi:hypothetical protein